MIELIMCTYNGVGYIEKQLDSIRCQTRQLDKVSIFDDISTDNTVEIIKKYINKYGLSEKWSLNVNAENKGWRRNFYDAIFASTGDIVFFCDQDDIWLLDKVEVMTKCFENNSKMLKLNSFYTLIDQDDKLVENDNVYNALPCNNTKIIKKN